MQRLDRHGRIRPLPFQQPGVPEAAGLTYAEAESTVWAIGADGTRYSGAEAINATLAVALGWPWLLRLYRIPWVGHLQDRLYDWIAANRHRFPGLTPTCEHPNADCGPTPRV